MGALTSSRNKRQAEFQFGYEDPHISKKLRSSSSSRDPNPIKSLVSRLSLYPQQLTPITREIHAPSTLVNGFTTNSKRFYTRGDWMGNLLVSKYRETAITSCNCSHVVFQKEETETDQQIVNDIIKSGELQNVISKHRDLDGETEENLGFQPSASSTVVSNLVDGKILESSLSVNHRPDDGLPLYMKLLHYVAEKRDSVIRRLSFHIKLQEKKILFFKQLGHPKKEEDIPIEPFQPLTEEEMKMVDNAFANLSRRKVLVTHENSNIIITGEVLRCLRLGQWLNDEVINVYLELLKEREKKQPQKFLKCHFFNTFFYKKLTSGRIGYDYKSVRRWTTQKKLGYSLFECDKIFVPVHKEIHWCLAVINKKEAKFQYLDSLGGIDEQVMRVLAKYIVDEVKDKNGKDIDVTSWKQEYVKDLPKQKNGNDCGVFMIKYADFYSRDIGLCFKQEHMPYFRQRTAKEILRLKAD